MVISDDPESDLGLLEFGEDMTKRMIGSKDGEGKGKDGQGNDLRDNRKNESTDSGSKEKTSENPAMPLHFYTLTAGPTARPHRRCALAGCNCLCSCGCSCDLEKNDAEERQAESKSSSSAKLPFSSGFADYLESKDSAEQDFKHNERDSTDNNEDDDYAMLLSLPDYNFEATSLPCSRHWDGAQLAFANVANRWLTINPDY